MSHSKSGGSIIIAKKMEIKSLISECTAYDFKLMLEEKKPKSWLKSVSAFANGHGGSLFFGVDNDSTVKALKIFSMLVKPLAVKFVTTWILFPRLK